MPPPLPPSLDMLRAWIGRIEHPPGRPAGTFVPLGIGAIDHHLPGGGLAAGALHEVMGAAADIEHGAAAARFVAWVLARTHGPVLWVSARRDLFAPGLAAAGLSADRVVHVEAGRAVLAAMEEGLRLGCPKGMGGVVGEVEGRFGLTPSRRLHLAAEAAGVIAFALRRSRSPSDPALAAPTAAVTRWRIAALPSAPPAAAVPGLGPARWQLDLLRARGGEPSSWIMEAGDAPDYFRLAGELGDGPAAADQPGRRAAGGGTAGHLPP